MAPARLPRKVGCSADFLRPLGIALADPVPWPVLWNAPFPKPLVRLAFAGLDPVIHNSRVVAPAEGLVPLLQRPRVLFTAFAPRTA